MGGNRAPAHPLTHTGAQYEQLSSRVMRPLSLSSVTEPEEQYTAV
jgi:hypothetical protein